MKTIKSIIVDEDTHQYKVEGHHTGTGSLFSRHPSHPEHPDH